MTAKKPRSGSVKCTCFACGSSFGVVPARAALGDGKYCSDECRNEYIGYKRMIKAVLPCTMRQMTQRATVTIDTARKIVRRALETGEWHASGLVNEDRRIGRGASVYALIYDLGPGTDPDLPRNTRDALTHYYKQLILASMPGCQITLRERTGLRQSTISRLVRELHDERKCHIGSWKSAKRGRRMARYKAGPGKDAVDNFIPLSSTEINARYKAKLARSGRLEQAMERWAANSRAAKARRKGDPLVNALFGKPADRLKEAA